MIGKVNVGACPKSDHGCSAAMHDLRAAARREPDDTAQTFTFRVIAELAYRLHAAESPIGRVPTVRVIALQRRKRSISGQRPTS
jgi:hypothetical protein